MYSPTVHYKTCTWYAFRILCLQKVYVHRVLCHEKASWYHLQNVYYQVRSLLHSVVKVLPNEQPTIHITYMHLHRQFSLHGSLAIWSLLPFCFHVASALLPVCLCYARSFSEASGKHLWKADSPSLTNLLPRCFQSMISAICVCVCFSLIPVCR